VAIVLIQLCSAVSPSVEEAIIRAVADAVSSYASENFSEVKVAFSKPLAVDLPVSEDVRLQTDETSQQLVRADYISLSTVNCSPSELKEYIDLRHQSIEPTMMAQPGYVSTTLLSIEDSSENLMILNKWISEEQAEAYGSSDVHRVMRKLTLEVLGKPLNSRSVDVIHHDGVTNSAQPKS